MSNPVFWENIRKKKKQKKKQKHVNMSSAENITQRAKR